MSKRVSIVRSKIVDYWTNTNQGYKRVKAIKEKVGSYPSFVSMDIDCPECFACAIPMRSKSTRKDPLKNWRDVWNKTSLERAHIIPHSKGGESIPSNLVLLCKDCHRDNPDSLNETFFWKWICSRPHYTQRRLQALQQIPLNEKQLSDLEEVISHMDSKQLNDLVEKSWKAIDPVLSQGKASSGSIAEMIHHVADNCKQLKDPLKSGDQVELF